MTGLNRPLGFQEVITGGYKFYIISTVECVLGGRDMLAEDR
jgi:hypothetical protein